MRRMAPKNCWEVMGCRRGPAGARPEEARVCPAAGDEASDGTNGGKNGGRVCWTVSGTFCGGEAQGTFAQKQLSCMSCKFYGQVKREEGERFVLLRPGQQYLARKR